GLRILLADEFFEFLRQSPREFLFGLARLREAVMVRTARMQNPRDRQVEIQLIVRQPRERSRRDGHTVIGLVAADDFLFSRPGQRVCFVPDELVLTVRCPRTRGAKKNFRHWYRAD